MQPKRARAQHQRTGAGRTPIHCLVSVLPRRAGWGGRRRRRCTLRAGGPGGALPAGRLPRARVHDSAHGAAERAAAAILAPADAGDPGRRHGPRRVQKPPAAARADKEGAPPTSSQPARLLVPECLLCPGAAGVVRQRTDMRAQIMKSDEDVRMISAEAPVLFARVRARPVRVRARRFFALLLSRRHDPGPLTDRGAPAAGVRDVHPGAHAAVLEPFRGEQAAHAAAQRHRGRHYADGHLRLPGTRPARPFARRRPQRRPRCLAAMLSGAASDDTHGESCALQTRQSCLGAPWSALRLHAPAVPTAVGGKRRGGAGCAAARISSPCAATERLTLLRTRCRGASHAHPQTCGVLHTHRC